MSYYDDAFDDIIDPLGLYDFDGDGELSPVESSFAMYDLEQDELEAENGHDLFTDDSVGGFSPASFDTGKEYSVLNNSSERIEYIQRVINGEDWYSDDPDKLNRCKYLILHQELPEVRYINAEGRILYGQCANDNFDFAVKFNSEDSTPKLLFGEVFGKIAQHDLTQALSFWKWCFLHFMPYHEYLDSFEADVLTGVISCLNEYSDNDYKAFAELLTADENLLNTWIESFNELHLDIGYVIKAMLEIGNNKAAESIIVRMFAIPGMDCSDIEFHVGSIIRVCTDYDDLTAIYGVKEFLMPIIESKCDAYIKKRIPKWASDMEEHIDYLESERPQYAYSGKNAWRMNYKDNSFSIDPTEFDCEADFLDELEQQGVSIPNEAINESYRFIGEVKEQVKTETITDKTVYTYYGVLFPDGRHLYHYFANEEYKLGDTVIAPIGDRGEEMQGTVVSIQQHLKMSVPFPPEKTKYIKKRVIDD